MKTYTFRLIENQDLRKEIDEFVRSKNISAGVILTCVGNMKSVVVRMADSETIKKFEGTFEIVSLVGTLETGNSHLHISFSDENGVVTGGHLKQDSLVGVTAEVVIGELDGTKFKRTHDPNTGYEELEVEEKF